MINISRKFKYVTLFAVPAAMTIAHSANAVVDVSATTTEIASAAAAVLLVGAAVIIVKVGVRLYKWAASAL